MYLQGTPRHSTLPLMHHAARCLPPLALRAALVLAAVLVSPQAMAQVCQGNVELRTQAQVNAFACTEVTRNLTIGPSTDIVDLGGLAELTTVGKTLWILANSALANVDGLAALTTIGGALWIGENAALTNVDGLSGVTTIGGVLWVEENDALANVDGLAALTTIRGGLNVEDNDGLSNLNGLSGVTDFEGSLQITFNDALINLDGLAGIAPSADGLTVSFNALLPNLDGLAGIGALEEGLSLFGNPALVDVDGLAGITSFGFGLYIEHNDALANLDGLRGATTVEDDLSIEDNPALTDCTTGLAPLLSGDGVGGAIDIRDNAPGCNSVCEVVGACSHADLAVRPTGPLTVPPGGELPFAYTIANYTGAPATGDLYFAASYAGDFVAGAVIRSGALPDGETIRGTATLRVPGGAPEGSYELGFSIGRAFNQAIDSETFVVTVEGPAAPKHGAAWTVVYASPWETVASATEVPGSYALHVAAPNPFAGRTTLRYDLPEAGPVRLAVYDVIGREVAVLVDAEVEAGRHEAVLDGVGLATGMYVVRLSVGGEAWTRRVTLVR